MQFANLSSLASCCRLDFWSTKNIKGLVSGKSTANTRPWPACCSLCAVGVQRCMTIILTLGRDEGQERKCSHLQKWKPRNFLRHWHCSPKTHLQSHTHGMRNYGTRRSLCAAAASCPSHAASVCACVHMRARKQDSTGHRKH